VKKERKKSSQKKLVQAKRIVFRGEIFVPFLKKRFTEKMTQGTQRLRKADATKC
jgi:hypothetical protein